MNKNKYKKAFTLIELMIVVAILGTLASIAVPKFANMIRRAKEGATKGGLGTLRTVVSIYYADSEGSYPERLAYDPGDDNWLLRTGDNKDGYGWIYAPEMVKYMETVPEFKAGPFSGVEPTASGAPQNLKRYTVWHHGFQFFDYAPTPDNGDAGWWYDRRNGKVLANTKGTDTKGEEISSW